MTRLVHHAWCIISTSMFYTVIQKVLHALASRFVCGAYRRDISVCGLISSLAWQTLEQRRSMTMVQTFNRIVYSQLDICLPSSLTQSAREHLRFTQPYTRINVCKYSFFPSSNKNVEYAALRSESNGGPRQVCVT